MPKRGPQRQRGRLSAGVRGLRQAKISLTRDVDMTAATVPGKLAREMPDIFCTGRWVRQG